MARLESDPKMNSAVMERIGRHLNLSLQQSHDFVQLAKLVGGYAEELLRAISPEQDVRLTAEQNEVEGSIYFATEMMVQKIDALFYLQDPLAARTRGRLFQVHPLIVKYVRVYQWKANQKNLSLAVTGACHESVYYDPQAIGAVAQALLDNMVKYAPADSYASVNFEVRGSTINISFNSLGPKILPQEIERIFSIGVRGEAARTIEESGQGVGLATARQVSEVLDLGLSVHQDPTEATRFPGHFSTTFGITLHAGGGY